jgi:hypothetical protein
VSLQTAAQEIHRMLLEHYASKNGVHAETVIGAAAALTGAAALQTLEPKLPDRGWVTSEKASLFAFGENESDKNCLWATITNGALEAGVAADRLPNRQVVNRRTVEAFGSSPYPPLSVSASHYPREWSMEAVPRFHSQLTKIGMRNQIGPAELAIALAFTTSVLIRECAKVLNPEIAVRLALEVMVGSLHMVPLTESMVSAIRR